MKEQLGCVRLDHGAERLLQRMFTTMACAMYDEDTVTHTKCARAALHR